MRAEQKRPDCARREPALPYGERPDCGRLDCRRRAQKRVNWVWAGGPGAGAGAASASLKRLWIKAKFPSWRLTAGKTRLAWGNGMVFNSGDLLFGSSDSAVDFTSSELRSDTAFLVAANVPTGKFSYLEGVYMPPVPLDRIEYSSGGMRAFFRVNGWRMEGGYFYKGQSKAASDILGHRLYFSVHGHAGVDLYSAVSVSAGTEKEARDTLQFSLGAFHQLQAGYSSTVSLRLETLAFPWGNWDGTVFGSPSGILLYPEISCMLFNTWFAGVQSVVSPVDASARISLNAGWKVFQGFTLLGFFVADAGGAESLFAWNRSSSWPAAWPDTMFNGAGVTLGARYVY